MKTSIVVWPTLLAIGAFAVYQLSFVPAHLDALSQALRLAGAG